MDGIEKKKFRFSKLADVKSVYIKRCIGLGLWGWSLGWVSGWTLGPGHCERTDGYYAYANIARNALVGQIRFRV